MRLEPECMPDALHGRRGVANFLGHGSQAPVRPSLGARLKRLADQGCNLVVADLARSPGTGLVVKTIHAAFGKTIAPRADGVLARANLFSDLLFVSPLSPLAAASTIRARSAIACG